MAEPRTYKVSLKRGMLDLTVPRSELIGITETPDGLSFKFKYGISVLLEDPSMTSALKQRICLSDTTFKNGDLIINLNDYRAPVSIGL